MYHLFQNLAKTENTLHIWIFTLLFFTNTALPQILYITFAESWARACAVRAVCQPAQQLAVCGRAAGPTSARANYLQSKQTNRLIIVEYRLIENSWKYNICLRFDRLTVTYLFEQTNNCTIFQVKNLVISFTRLWRAKWSVWYDLNSWISPTDQKPK